MNSTYSFSKGMEKCRKKKNTSRYKIHKETGITQAALFNYTRDNYEPSLRNLVKIADVLGVSLDELVGRNRN